MFSDIDREIRVAIDSLIDPLLLLFVELGLDIAIRCWIENCQASIGGIHVEFDMGRT